MNDCHPDGGPLGRFTKLLAMLGVLALTAGCSQSVHRVSYTAQDAAALQSLSPQDSLSPLANRSNAELLARGFAYLNEQNMQLARLHFMKALEKQPEPPLAYVGLGRIHIFEGQYPQAEEMFSRALEVEPKLVAALVGQAQALRLAGKMNAAIGKVNEAMLVTPDDLAVLNELAIIYDLMGRETLAEPLYREIVERAPDIAANHNNLGMNLMIRGQYPEAINAFLQALELDGNNLRTRNNLASAYALSGENEKALRIFTDTVGEAAAYNNLGYFSMTQGRYDEAEYFLRKAMTSNPKYYEKAQENLDRLAQMRHTAGR